jgi:predicted Rdx family selenoprotein
MPGVAPEGFIREVNVDFKKWAQKISGGYPRIDQLNQRVN